MRPALLALLLLVALPLAKAAEDGEGLDAPPRMTPLLRLEAWVQAEAWERCGSPRERVQLLIERDGGGQVSVVDTDLAPGSPRECVARAISGRVVPDERLRPGTRNLIQLPWGSRWQDAQSELRRGGGQIQPAIHDGAPTRPYDPSIVVDGIRSQLREVQRCYEATLRTQPGLAGKVTVRFTLVEAGRNVDAHATENTTGHHGLALCVVNAITALHFSRYPTGGALDFSYPFVFAPQN